MTVFTAITAIVTIVLSCIVVYWTREMGACPCAASWKRGFLMWGYAVFIVTRLLILLRPTDRTAYFNVYFPFIAASLVFNIVLFGVLLSYARDLEKLKCECSEGWQRKVAFVWPAVYFSLLSFLVTILLVGLLSMKAPPL